MSQGYKGGHAQHKARGRGWPGWLGWLLVVALWVGISASMSGCGPDSGCGDDDCASRGEVCGPNGQCVACLSPMDCSGECSTCRDGRCVRTKGCCEADSDCPADRPFCKETQEGDRVKRLCIQCTRDSNCPQPGQICEKGACNAPLCSDTEPCPDFQVCNIEERRCAFMRLCEFKEVFFHTGRHEIPDDQTPKLASNAACFNRYRQATGDRVILSVSGHADERGEDNANLRLSERRAQAIISALQKRGIPKEKLRVRAAGEREPLVPEADSAIGHQWNRRVEFTLR